MALIVIVDDDGRQHLIHSSQLGPQFQRAIPLGAWQQVWSRFDTEPRLEPPAPETTG